MQGRPRGGTAVGLEQGKAKLEHQREEASYGTESFFSMVEPGFFGQA